MTFGDGHTVVSGLPPVVGPRGHEVTQIDDKSIGHKRDVFPFSVS